MANSHNTLARTARCVLDDYEMARVEAATVISSLSPASAREVRVERIILFQPNPVAQARTRGFYDFMLGRPSQALDHGKKLEVSYAQGWAKGVQRRAMLKGRPWYETEKQREGGKWTWRIYREAYFEAQGTAPNESRADEDIEVAKAELMDRYSDWACYRTAPVSAEQLDEDEATGQRM